MAKQRPPEQRSSKSGEATPNSSAPQPTGNESYQSTTPGATSTAASRGSTLDQPQSAEGALAENAKNIREIATQYYEKLTESAEVLTQQAQRLRETGDKFAHDYPGSMLGSAFVVGVLLGILTYRS